MAEITEIPIVKIKVGEHEQRLKIDDDEIAGLAVSIGRIGVVEPLLLAKQGDTLQLVSGHRRLLAAAHVGFSTVPCIVVDSSKGSLDEITFAENFFRKDLSPMELASAIADCYKKAELTLDELAAGFHRSKEWVQRMIAMCDWPSDVLEAIHNEQISVSAGSNLAIVTDDSYRSFLVRNAVEQGATARTTASWLQAWRAMQPREEAITLEPVSQGKVAMPLVPQAPCLCCGQIFPVNEMSHVPVCGGCIQVIRNIGTRE